MATPIYLSSRVCAATIQGWLLFLSQSCMCGYYLRAATNWGAASILMNAVCQEKQCIVDVISIGISDTILK